MDLANWHWKAVHSDKIVEKPNYIDINRDTLQEFIVSCDGKEFVFKKPNKEGRFQLVCRLRNDMSGDADGHLHALKRHVLVFDGKWYHIIGEEGTSRKVKKLNDPIEFKSNLGELE